jgi:hypothetical protein
MSNANLPAQTLGRAAAIVGLGVLADRLGISAATLSMLIQGGATVPADMFLLATEIITDAGVTEAVKTAPK